MKCNCRFLSLLSLLLLFCVSYAAAQNSATLAIGFGTIHAKSSPNGITYDQPTGTLQSCDVLNDSYCYSRRTLDGLFMGFGGDMMPWNRIGFGFNISFQPVKRTYSVLQDYSYPDLKSRQTFYEFNGIYAPVTQKRTVLKLMGGIGGAHQGYIFSKSSVVGSDASISAGSSNRFQLHAGVGVELYVTRNAFIRPQYDFRYIPNFTNQFGTNTVSSGMIWIGVKTGGK